MESSKQHIHNNLIREDPGDLYEHAPCGYMSVLPDGTIVKVNQTLLNWLGHQREDLISSKRFQELLPIGGKIFYETHHAPLIKMQGFVNELSYDILCKNGNTVPVLLNSQVVKDEAGQVAGFRNTLFNITDRKKYERELLLAKKKAEQAVIAKSEFLSTISHEIRTPLNAIIGLTHILNEENTDPKNQEYLNILKFSANNLLALINDILDLSRIESGKVMLEEKDFNLKEMLQAIAATFRLRAEKKGIEVTLQSDENLPEIIVGDQLKIGQIFTNLLGNSIKFTEKGRITMEALVKQQTSDRAIVYFSITDTGIGIPQDKIDAIFEEFTQANSQINIQYGGTGLGLSISRKILELYGSRMAVESELGKGSKFYFTLNLKIGNKANVSIDDAGKITDDRKLAGARVLLCEDNDVNVLIVTKYLKGWDIDFEVAENGSIGLQKIQENYYDLILMDLQMPVMDGYEATQKIRQLAGGRFKHLPVLALTAATDQDTREKVVAVGMNDYITKPFEPKEFYNKLVKYIPLNFLSENDIDSLAGKSSPASGEKLINYDKFVEMADGDAKFLAGLTEETINNFKNYKAQFRTAIKNEDKEQMRFLAHKSKLVIELLEIKNLDSLIKKSISALEENDSEPPEAENYIPEIEYEIDRVITELRKRQPHSL